MSNKTPLYDQVKEILNKLQGSTVPSYQGLKAFWLDPDVFMTAELYGHRLIAPEPGASSDEGSGSSCGCCSTSGEAATTSKTNIINLAIESSDTGYDCWPSGGSYGGNGSDPGSSTSRSDQSAIIYGMKGQYPFDGSIFPPLLWDAAKKPTTDQIQLIANWIDAGCPRTKEEEEQRAADVKKHSAHNEKKALARGEQDHPVSTNKANKDQSKNKGVMVRKAVHSMTAEEITTLRDAIGCMYRYNGYFQDERSYDFWARIHTNSCQHGYEQFLPWHRLYLYFFEQKLQDYDASITLPYWNWPDYADENKSTFNNTQPDLGVLPDTYGCFLTQESVNTLKAATDVAGKPLYNQKQIKAFERMAKRKTVYQSGARFLKAARIDYELENNQWSEQVKFVYQLLKQLNPLWTPMRWPGSSGGDPGGLIYPTHASIQTMLTLAKWPDFGGGPSYDHHYGSLEKVHNGMHLFSGGMNPDWEQGQDPQGLENPQVGYMTDNRTAAYDPIFWAHHSNVDRVWALWQEQHAGIPEELSASLAPWPMTVQDTLSTKKLGYVYMKDSKHFEVDPNLAISKFSGAPAQLSSNTLSTFSKAEIVLHRVRRGNLPSVHIRVFVNDPKANFKTSLDGNDHLVEVLSVFHGSCYGGPGHCNLPLDKTRPFDHRPLHHHEPRNFKIDATDAVRKMLAKGESDITIQLVVVGLDGKPHDEALYFEGVSLHMHD